MNRIAPIVVAGLALLGVGLPAPPARAQATTTFVSGFGLDTNPCTTQNPCRSFQHAHDQTAAGGQITMLDPAGYGDVTITKAISIVNDGGGEAGINDPSTGIDAVTINAGAGDVVSLRGLTVNGVGTGRNGIIFNSGGALNIQNCVIRGFKNSGVAFQPGASAAITIIDTIVSNNRNGVTITPVRGTTTVSLERIAAIANSGDGIALVGPGGGNTVEGAIVDGASVRNAATGFMLSSGAAAATIALINSEAIGNGIGVTADSGTIVMSRVTVAGNTTDGFTAVSLESFGDNYIIDTTNSGSLTPISPQ